MVKRAEFETITHAQDVIEAKYGVKFAVQVDWHLSKEFHFDDETPTSGGIGG